MVILLLLLGVTELFFFHESLIPFPVWEFYGKYPHVSYGHIVLSIGILILLYMSELHLFVCYLKNIQDEENYSLYFVAFIEAMILFVPIICLLLGILLYAGLFDY